MKQILTSYFLICVVSTSYSQRCLSDKDKMYIRNAIRIEDDKFKRAYKRKDDFLVVKFKKTKWILTPTGYVDEIYVLVDRKWVVKED